MKSKLFVAATCAVLGSASMLSTDVGAAEVVYSGNACQAYWGNEVTDINVYNSSTFNTSYTELRWVSCPIIRHNTTNVDGPQFVYARVLRSDTTGHQLSCFLRSYSSLGTLLDTHSQYISSSSPTSISLDVDTGGSSGYYTLTCNLPPRSYIYSYRVGEP